MEKGIVIEGRRRQESLRNDCLENKMKRLMLWDRSFCKEQVNLIISKRMNILAKAKCKEIHQTSKKAYLARRWTMSSCQRFGDLVYHQRKLQKQNASVPFNHPPETSALQLRPPG
jgi:hypothetical protein